MKDHFQAIYLVKKSGQHRGRQRAARKTRTRMRRVGECCFGGFRCLDIKSLHGGQRGNARDDAEGVRESFGRVL